MSQSEAPRGRRGRATIVTLPFAFDTPGLCDGRGVSFFQASRGDVLLDSWIEGAVEFDGGADVLELRTAAGHVVAGGKLRGQYRFLDVGVSDDDVSYTRQRGQPFSYSDGPCIIRKDTLLTLHVTFAGEPLPDPLPTQGRGEFGLLVIQTR